MTWAIRQSVIVACCLFSAQGLAEGKENELRFNTSFLRFSDGESADTFNLDYFARSGGMQPGSYWVTVLVNDKKVDARSVDFISDPRQPGRLYACITSELLTAWGIQVVSKQPQPQEEKTGEKTAGSCAGSSLSSLIPQAKEIFDYNQSTLMFAVPQANIAPPGWLRTPEALWSQGVPAAMINYDYSGTAQNNDGGRQRSDFISLNGLASWQRWRLRHDMTYSASSGSASQLNNLNTYLQRDYSFWQGGQLTLGQTSTDGAILDSTPFKGVMMSSDDGMINSELGAFAPVIRGIARSQAVVTVRQNERVLYQQSVPPGAFELRDFAQSYAGDVDVEIKEADGTVRTFRQASATVPVLQREGRVRYSLALGEYGQRGSDIQGISPYFGSATAAWGASSGTTLYGGGLYSQDYLSAVLGVGQYLPRIGAFSADVTYAGTRAPGQSSRQGQAYRLSYARAFESTSVNIAAYRYASQGFYSFNEAMMLGNASASSGQVARHERSRMQASVSQSLGRLGSLSLSGSHEDYWNASGYGQSLTGSYGMGFPGVSFSLSASYNKTPYYGNADKLLSLNVSVPLGRWAGQYAASAYYTMTRQRDVVTHLTGVSGSLMDDGNLSYSLSQGWSDQKDSAAGNASLGYASRYNSLNVGYGYQAHSTQQSYGVNGGLSLHPHGVTLSQPLSLDGANALITMPGVSGVRVNGGNIVTDWMGNAIIPNLVPYTLNDISVDTQSLREDVDVKDTNFSIVPSRGTLVPVRFQVEQGRRVLFTLTHNRKPLPFGALASVQIENEMRSGMVASEGQAYLSGLPDKGILQVSWGTQASERCTAVFDLSGEPEIFSARVLTCQ